MKRETPTRLLDSHTFGAIGFVGGAVVIMAAASLWIGSWRLGPQTVMEVLTGGGGEAERMAILGFRLPRILFALFAGAGLSVSGAIFQAVLRNDLAAPGVLGVSAGGHLAVVVVLLAGGLEFATPWVVPIASIIGGAATMAIVCALANEGNSLAPNALLLTGVAISASMGSASQVISLQISPEVHAYAVSWMSGSLTQGNWNYVIALTAWLAPLLTLAWVASDSLNVMQLGDSTAVGLGIPLRQRRIAMLVLAVALSGVCMALAGGILFLGLLAPHIARRLMGPNHQVLIPATALIGAALLLLSDTICRTIFAPLELPAGVAVNAFGAPYFLYLLMRS